MSPRAALRALPFLLAALAVGAAACGPPRSLGETLWRDRCAGCHGVDGRGNTPRYMGNSWADLVDERWKYAGDPEGIGEVARAGITGVMPANDDLSREEMTALVDWLLGLRGETR